MITHNAAALILVDLQNDFCKNGSLAVPDGDAVVLLANQLQAFFDHIIATQDWHPPDHLSFASNHPGQAVGNTLLLNNLPQILWPDHCVQYTRGADFHPDLQRDKIEKIFQKGVDKYVDSYSAFYDNAHLRSTGLSDYLIEKKMTTIYLLGLATDFCVKYSACDAVSLGFKTYVIADACRGVELTAGDSAKAFNEMKAAGVTIIQSADIFNH